LRAELQLVMVRVLQIFAYQCLEIDIDDMEACVGVRASLVLVAPASKLHVFGFGSTGSIEQSDQVLLAIR
jgi:hypothetical protein